MARIFCRVLRVDDIGRHDQFFDRGGDSLRAVEVIERVKASLEASVPNGDMLCLWVTFLEDLASLNDRTTSIVAEISTRTRRAVDTEKLCSMVRPRKRFRISASPRDRSRPSRD